MSSRMADAAAAFLDTLEVAQRAAAAVPFADLDARRDWHYVPRRRAGLAFRDMTSAQEQRAYELVRSGLSLPAFAAVTTVIGLEDVLDLVEGGRRSRHRADYSVTVFDEPGDPAWAWRFEGHHVSVNVTVVGGAVAATPLFLGANPAEVLTSTGAVVTRPLAGEEDLARDLVDALAPGQRDAALLDATAPDDILTVNAPAVDDLPAAGGVRLGELAGSASRAAGTLVRHYLGRLPPQAADAWWERLQPELGDLRFAVAGAWRPDDAPRGSSARRPQYYRLAGPRLLIEYDNTQNGANHVHTVLRDPSRDFGADLLRQHRADHHGGATGATTQP